MAVKRSAEVVRTATPSEQRAMKKRKSDVGVAMPAPAPVEQQYESKARPVDEFPELVDVLPELARESVQLTAEIKEREVRRKEIADMVGPLLIAAGHDSIKDYDWIAIRAKSSTPAKIKPELLLAHGVSMSTIEECTEPGKEYYKVQISAVRVKAGE